MDLTHAIPPFDVRKGAFVLSSAVSRLSASVHLAIVDPGVGGGRAGLALETARGDRLVGPDNGLLIPAAERLGGVRSAVSLTNARYFLEPVCPTFHGRDIFAPAAAHLARGVPIGELGEALPLEAPAPAPWSLPRIGEGEVKAEVVDQDRFGTLRLGCYREDLERAGLPIAPGSTLVLEAQDFALKLPLCATFSEVGRGEVLALFDSSDRLAVAANMGEASLLLPLRVGDAVTLKGGGPGRREK